MTNRCSMEDTDILTGCGSFPETRWNLVSAAREARALHELITLYWRPLYFFVRRQGYANETAKDVVQEFLMTMIERNAILKADRARGRFRTYLLAALSNFLKDWAKSASREKRTPPEAVRSLDFARGEEAYLQVASHECSPETLIDRAWARELLDQSLAELESDPVHLEAFRQYREGTDYRTISERTGLSEACAKTTVHRLKAQLRAIVIGRLRATAQSDEELRQDLEDFIGLLGR